MNSKNSPALSLLLDLACSRVGISWVVFFSLCAVIAMVLGFEHIGGYIPCALCLEQRVPYYYAIPVGFLTAIGASMAALNPNIVRLGLIVVAVLVFWSLALAAYHSGVEWGYWLGPSECAAPVSGEGFATSADGLLGQLSGSRPPSCNEAAGRFLGLSFAGWNVIVSAGIIFIALRGALIREDT